MVIILVPIIPEFLYDIQHPDQPLTATIPPSPRNEFPVPHGDMSSPSGMYTFLLSSSRKKY